MPKKKKTLEELLEEALVPEDEVPYKVPENWVFTNLGTLISVSSGKGLPKSKMNSEGSVPVYGGNGITGVHDTYNIEEEKIIIGRVGANCGNVHITNTKAWVTDNAFIVSYPDEKLNKMYLYRLLNKINLGQYSKSSAQPVISGQKIYPVSLPLPPLSEQKRIVEKIESLFSKLDKSKALIEEAREDFKNRKSSILAKAFRGELTKKWREENTGVECAETLLKRIEEEREKLNSKKKKTNDSDNIESPYEIPEKWKWVKIGDITDVVSGGTPKTSCKEYYENGNISWITPADLSNYQEKYIHYGKRNITELGLNKSSAKLLKKDTLLLSSRAPIGYVVIAGKELCTNQGFKSFEPTKAMYHIYGYWYLKFSTGLIESYASGTTFKEISAKKARIIPVPLPPIEEQIQIVKILDKLLEEESKIEELTQIENQIELIKKSILAKAFRGELGTNDPSEESALELLKDILKEKL
ncbi:restriction endonuclease subunit S [Tepidibacter mesophilus]|uniref:restriction endonuclease subunit S n=1 Tax=Tepidibacter mesophilus TaxID=655607 RepID=UPI000C07C84F|nr:restriction endonuclease subunit S [Tepidibacter mesophilus]